MDLSSPWKFSMDGIVGIDDIAIIAVIKLHPVPRLERLELLRDVQALLRGGLTAIFEQREKRSKK